MCRSHPQVTTQNGRLASAQLQLAAGTDTSLRRHANAGSVAGCYGGVRRLHSCTGMHRRFNHEPKVSDEPLVRSSSPDQLNSDPHITARKAVDSHKDRSNEKNQAKKVKAQNRRNRRDQEFAKLTGRAFVTRKG